MMDLDWKQLREHGRDLEEGRRWSVLMVSGLLSIARPEATPKEISDEINEAVKFTAMYQ
jgi:hypothetical protein